jgi:nicotinamide riboside transporter PnuC
MNRDSALLVIGILFFAVAAFFMIDGQIAGERTIPIAIISTIMGVICVAARRKKHS